MIYRKPCSLSFVVCALLAGGSSGAQAAFTLQQALSAPFASDLKGSPRGDRIAWLLNEQGRRNVYMASAPDWKAHRVTAFDADDGQEIAELCWAPNGQALLFARGGDFEMGRENPNPATQLTKPEQAIWMARVDDTPAKRLGEGHLPVVSPRGDRIAFLKGGQPFTMAMDGSKAEPLLTTSGSVAHLRWSPDGSALAFVNGRQDHSYIAVYVFGSKQLRFLDSSVDSDSQPVWSPDGTHLAFLRAAASSRAFAFGPEREGEPFSIRVADIASGRGREVWRADRGRGSVFHPVVADEQLLWAQGDRLVFPWEKDGWCHLYAVSIEGGPAVPLTPGAGEVEHVTLAGDRKSVLYSTNQSDIDRRHVWQVALAEGQRPRELTTGEGIEWQPAALASELGVAYLASTERIKAHAEVRLASGRLVDCAAGAVPADFPGPQFVAPQPVLLPATDGLVVHAQLFLPPGPKGTKHPALIFLHGGSRRQMLLGFHYMYYYSNAYTMNQFLASQGFVVLAINYRSGIGYGMEFREARNYGATGASEWNDVAGAGLYLRSRDDVDPARVGLWGGSYGGYLTALGLARASDLFAAGVDFHGVHDWNNVIHNFVPAYDPKQQAEVARIAFESSPLSAVAGWRSPVLLIHGDDDRNVPFGETVKLVEALRKQGVPLEQLIFPNEIHDFLLHRSWLEAYQATAEFFQRKLQR